MIMKYSNVFCFLILLIMEMIRDLNLKETVSLCTERKSWHFLRRIDLFFFFFFIVIQLNQMCVISYKHHCNNEMKSVCIGLGRNVPRALIEICRFSYRNESLF